MRFGLRINAVARATWSVVIITALACSGDGPTPPPHGGGVVLPPNPPLVGGTATTPTVSVVLEQGRSASATIGVEGGAIVAHGARGATFTLTVPAGAVLVPTQITVTPVASMSGNEVAGSAIATAALAPSGLQLLQVGTLRIDLASASGTPTVGVGYSGAGEDFHLMPALPRESAQSFEIPISHFSGAGISAASTAAINALAQQIGASAQSRLEQALGAALGKKNGEPLTDADIAQIRQILGDYYSQVVKPRLLAAQTDDAQLASAVQTYFNWERATELLGLDFSAARDEGRSLVFSAVVNHYRQAYGRCAQKRDFTQVRELVSVIRFMELMGVADMLPSGGVVGAAECADMRLEFTSSIHTPGVTAWQTRGQVPLPLLKNVDSPIQAQGPHTVLSFALETRLACPAGAPKLTDGQLVIVEFAFEPDSNGIKNVSLGYDPIAGGPSATVTQNCPAPLGAIMIPFFYGSDFVVLHSDEYKTAPQPAWYVTSGWEEGSGEILMRRLYSRTVAGRTEETELLIRHTPKPLP